MAKWNGNYTWDTPPSKTGASFRLSVATCQIPVTHDINQNASLIIDLVHRAAQDGADVAHFPEGAISGYGPADWPNWDSYPWETLEAVIERVQAAARDNGIWVVIGSVYRDGPDARPTNSVLVFDRQRRLAGRYDKRRCSVNDLRAFAPGQEQLIVSIEGVKCGSPMIPG